LKYKANNPKNSRDLDGLSKLLLVLKLESKYKIILERETEMFGGLLYIHLHSVKTIQKDKCFKNTRKNCDSSDVRKQKQY
jgi:hypothetical protein